MHPWLTWLIILTQLFAPLPDLSAEFSDVGVFISFGEKLTFQARVQTQANIQETYLFLQPAGEETRLIKLAAKEGSDILYQYPLAKTPIRPFSKVSYWFRLVGANGEKADSQVFSFTYEDNRFKWKTLEEPGLQVFWYSGDLTFGQAALNAARTGLKSARAVIPVEPPNPVRIYVYAEPKELQEALRLGSSSWVAGHASPDLGVVLVSIPPGPEQVIEMERQIPHELTHILQYQSVGAALERAPQWLVEGTASIAEIYPYPDYQRALQYAVEKRSLLPIASLCDAFPSEASGAFLGYAESASFSRWLLQKYGNASLNNLFNQYKTGKGCEEGFAAAMGVPLAQAESLWHQEVLGINTGFLALEKLSPYILITLALVLIPMGTLVKPNRRKSSPSINADK